MKQLSIALAIIILIPAAARAVRCHAVDYYFDASSADVNSANIVKSGWGKFTAFQTPVPPIGWFLFIEGVRVFAVNQGVVGPLQWGVNMQNVEDGSDCDPIFPSPLDPPDGEGPGDPDEPSIAWFPMGCWAGKVPQVEISWWGGAAGVDYVVQQYGFGSWQPWYDGSMDCVNTTVSQHGTDFRVKTVNIFGESDWVYTTASGFCENF